jgi:hypothetical protein
MTVDTQFLLSSTKASSLLSDATSASGILSGPEWSRLILTLVLHCGRGHSSPDFL